MQRNILIDGWRGLSVICVIIGHLVGYRFGDYFEARPFRELFMPGAEAGAVDIVQNIFLRFAQPLPSLGVDVFFIISGYLITELLLREERSCGRISFTGFYARRVFRILPAFVCYLTALFLLARVGVINVSNHALIVSGLFLCDFPNTACPWWVGHTWSLSVEEQYYLAWPLLFVLLRKKRAIALGAFIIILLSISFEYQRSLSFTCIAIGALVATSPAVARWIGALPAYYVVPATVGIIFVQPFVASFPFLYWLIAAIRPVFLAFLFFGTLKRTDRRSSFFASPPLRIVGLCSYSIYLWQQLFTAPPELYPVGGVLLIPVLLLGPAVISYVAIERPLIAIGHRLSDELKVQSANRSTVGS